MSHFVTVVTGAAGALGAELTAELIQRGQRVAAIDRPAAAERLQGLSDKHGAHCLPVPLDALSASDWTNALERVEKQLGPPEGAVLVAGGWKGGAPFHSDASQEAWQSMLELNLETARRSLHAILKGMVSRKGGSVVLIGSRAVERPWESVGASGYAVAKSAVVTLARVVAAEVLEHGVRVNAVLPSVIDTEANRRAMPKADPSRWVSSASLAQVIAFLLSDAARDVSGAALPVYGRA
jgi:NAD(P)-dependent dehydrogenase (short-subunit alcohol dehydrogenase family)